MSVDLYERIAAAVGERRIAAEWYADKFPAVSDFMLAACDYADKVLARHGEHPIAEGHCDHDLYPWPCPEVRDLADLWLGPGWEAGEES